MIFMFLESRKNMHRFLANSDTKYKVSLRPIFILIRPIYMPVIDAGEHYYARDNTRDKVFPAG